MLEIRDYGFAAFLVQENVEYKVKLNNKGKKYFMFNLSEADHKALVVQYRQSCFYTFNNTKRKLTELLK